jgi:hypothetical protein
VDAIKVPVHSGLKLAAATAAGAAVFGLAAYAIYDWHAPTSDPGFGEGVAVVFGVVAAGLNGAAIGLGLAMQRRRTRKSLSCCVDGQVFKRRS